MKQCPHCGKIFVQEDLERCPHDNDLLDQLTSFENISNAKYIFLDVVGFTQDRSIEAQSDIVYALNEIVRYCVEYVSLPEDKVIYIPTGDGLCIALLNVENPYDIHLQIALYILKRLQTHNNKTQNDTRKFQVRVGLNAHLDNLVIDINGHRNIAGAGISIASRIMGLADGNQILVGQSVYETLRYRERYSNSFKGFRG